MNPLRNYSPGAVRLIQAMIQVQTQSFIAALRAFQSEQPQKLTQTSQKTNSKAVTSCNLWGKALTCFFKAKDSLGRKANQSSSSLISFSIEDIAES